MQADQQTPSIAPQPASERPWWLVRQERFRAGVAALRDKEVITVTQPFAPIDNDIPGVNVLFANQNYFIEDPTRTADIYFSQGYSPDIPPLWDVVRSGRAGVTACWFWDNHHLIASTMRAAMLADISFCAHSFASHYVGNELGRYGGFVPLCSPFWSNSVARKVLDEVAGKPRADALYGGYNSYKEWPERDVFLRQVMEAIPNNVIKMWPHGMPGDQHPYYSLPAEEKLKDWCSHKVALCVSFGVNTTMRIFDALLAGQIPLVVGDVHDLDMIISPADQATLPVMRIRSLDAGAVREHYAKALQLFDSEGEAGIRRRSEFILAHHMPRNRVIQMVEAIRALDVG